MTVVLFFPSLCSHAVVGDRSRSEQLLPSEGHPCQGGNYGRSHGDGEDNCRRSGSCRDPRHTRGARRVLDPRSRNQDPTSLQLEASADEHRGKDTGV